MRVVVSGDSKRPHLVSDKVLEQTFPSCLLSWQVLLSSHPLNCLLQVSFMFSVIVGFQQVFSFHTSHHCLGPLFQTPWPQEDELDTGFTGVSFPRWGFWEEQSQEQLGGWSAEHTLWGGPTPGSPCSQITKETWWVLFLCGCRYFKSQCHMWLEAPILEGTARNGVSQVKFRIGMLGNHSKELQTHCAHDRRVGARGPT